MLRLKFGFVEVYFRLWGVLSALDSVGQAFRRHAAAQAGIVREMGWTDRRGEDQDSKEVWVKRGWG